MPVDPFVKNLANKRTVSFQESALGKANSFGRDEQTGVDLRRYKSDEYSKLKPVEKMELNAWQRTAEGSKIVANDMKTFHAAKKRLQEKGDAPRNRKKSKAFRTMSKQSAEIIAFKKGTQYNDGKR